MLRQFIYGIAIFLFLAANFELKSQIPRKALVIGNSDYDIKPLKNPVNDAKLMKAKLTQLGFQVSMKNNLSRSQLREAIIAFGDKLSKEKSVGLFYYAGHGIQNQGINYLVPIDAEIKRSWEIEDECVRLDAIFRMLSSYESDLNIVILDACRNEPYISSVISGLSTPQIEIPESIVAYATAPGETASDGIQDNGLYTSVLSEFISRKNLEIEKLFKDVRIEVAKKSDFEQIPWMSSSILKDFYFDRDGQSDINGKEQILTEEQITISNEIELREESNRSILDEAEKSRIYIHSSEDLAFPIYESLVAFGSKNKFVNSSRILELLKSKQIHTRVKYPIEDFNKNSFSIADEFRINQSGLQIGNILFERGRTLLIPESVNDMLLLAKWMNDNQDIKIIIEGHTDFQGHAGANMRLSEDRASVVKKHLIDGGTDKKRITTKAFGGTLPLSFARTKEAKKLNRRIEIEFFKNSTNRALFVEGQEFKNLSISKLKKNHSFDALQKALEDDYNYVPESLRSPTKESFIKKLQSYASSSYKSGDHMIIYMKSHLVQTETDIYVAFKNSKHNDGYSSWLNVKNIELLADQISIDNLLLVIDSK